jgi:hypothetical protein
VFHWLTGEDAVFRAGFSISTIREGMGLLEGVWSGNQGRSLSTSTSPGTTPSVFPAGSVLFSNPSYPTLAPTSLDLSFPNPTFPLAVQSGQTIEDYNPSIKPEYVESWTAGFQRQVGHNTVIEVRYVANHGVDLWSAVNLNEVNVVENGFATQTVIDKIENSDKRAVRQGAGRDIAEPNQIGASTPYDPVTFCCTSLIL